MNKLCIVLFTIISSFLISCDNQKAPCYAGADEKAIIDQMYCWNSIYAESKMTLTIFETDEKKKDKLRDEFSELQDETNVFGRKNLYNDTIFINCVRSDSVYKSLLRDRKKLVLELLKFKKSLPAFKKHIIEISKDIVKYDYYSTGFGIKRETYIPSNFLESEKFYNGMVDLFKEAYTQDTKGKITDKEVSSISDLLRKIENIDKHIWCVPEYLEAKNKLELVEKKIEQDQEKAKKFDELSNKK